jgi:nucleotide-binding universal stress UspA family protein
MSASQSQRSVTQYLAHHAPCALVIIRDGAE